MADDQYQGGWQDAVPLPDTSSDWSISKALQNYASPQVPDWSPENSSLSMLLDKDEIHDIAASGSAPGNPVQGAPVGWRYLYRPATLCA
jgi:hypothetical protein